jgi:hypothetical protein
MVRFHVSSLAAFFRIIASSSLFIRLTASGKLVVDGPGFTPSWLARPAMMASASARAFSSGVGSRGVGFTGLRGVFGGCYSFIKH